MTKISDIRSQTPKRSSTRNVSNITTIVRHHSATATGDFWAFWNGRWKGLNWTTGGYHEIILRDGTVQLCYDDNVVTNGAAGQNSYCYHICVVGNGSFTSLQEDIFDERCRLAMKRFDLITTDVKGHQELPNQATQCPGIDMEIVRARLKKEVEINEVTVIYGDQQIPAMLLNGKTMVQLRELATMLEVPIRYHAKTRTVTFNNQIVQGEIIAGRTYLHVREAAALVGLRVSWDGKTRIVILQ